MCDVDAKSERSFRLISFGTAVLSLAFLVINQIRELVESSHNYLANQLRSPVSALNFL